MENKLPQISKELTLYIEAQADDYAASVPDDAYETNWKSSDGYIAGATAYAHYKERWGQAMKALEQIANAPTPYNLEEMWSWIHTARNLSDKALASWKEGQAEKEPEPFTGSIFTSPAPGIAIGCISPEARDLLDTIMAKWEPHYQELKKNAPHVEITFYSLAYWLVRWSGLIQPAAKPEDTNKTE